MVAIATMVSSLANALEPNQLIQQVCVACHNENVLTASLSLQEFDANEPYRFPVVAEKMIRKLRAGQMPPREIPRSQEDILNLVETLEAGLDRAAKENPRMGTRPYQRLNRAEYAKLVYDLLGLTVDPAEWLPEDQISASFDNIADVQGMSPTFLVAYLNAASDIARRAIGQKDAPVMAKTFTNSILVSQHEWERADGAPYGTRGGISTLHAFPADGQYIFSMRFRLGVGQRFTDIDVSIDGEQVALLHYGGDIDYQGHKDFPVETSAIFVRAGEHRVTAAFIRQMDGPYEDLLKPNERSLTGIAIGYGTTVPTHLMNLTVVGPYNPVGISETPARKRIFICRPTSPSEEQPCARNIVRQLASNAFSQDLSEVLLEDLMKFYMMSSADGGFESGIQGALEAVLSSPRFLFRMEQEPVRARPGESFKIAGIDLAKRLSFFLWGTAPDKELLARANSGSLTRTRTLKKQAQRMLADPRSEALSTRFASLWLRLQDLEKVAPDEFWFPDYNYQLMVAMRQETQIFFNHLVTEDKSVLDLYGADYSYMNERLARHYDIPGVFGDKFRLVKYPNDQRKGVLGHGSILTQTSLGNRTSPVLRGKWVISVLLGTPPPPPPAGVPDLEETGNSQNGKPLTTRQRMEIHRKNPVCAACHKVMDPIGLALDNFDVTGKWRTRENDAPLETSSVFYDGTEISTAAELSQALLKRPVPLVREFTGNLMAFALGRRVEYYDQPTIRAIVSDAAKNEYRMSSLILGVILSDTFRMKDTFAEENLFAKEMTK